MGSGESRAVRGVDPMNGKGDRRRPQSISDEEMAKNWALAFSWPPPCGLCGEPSLGPGMCYACLFDIQRRMEREDLERAFARRTTKQIKGSCP